jgi:hypothetical protein
VYPHLSLDHIRIEPDIARRLPRRLAYYHLALPIAEDEDSITVAMAYPDNQAVITLIKGALNADIVPVHSHAEQIRQMLDRLWLEGDEDDPPRILAWSESPEWVEHTQAYANLFTGILSAQVDYLEADITSPDQIVHLTQKDYSLLVAHLPEELLPPLLLNKAHSSLLLISGPLKTLRRILVVLRGHAPDQDVLDHVIPLAKEHGADVTLLAVAQAATTSQGRSMFFNNFATLLTPTSEEGAHVASCTDAITAAGLVGELRLRQGTAECEIAEEIADGDYDLVAIAAEAYGDFVYLVLSEIRSQARASTSPILIVKP